MVYEFDCRHAGDDQKLEQLNDMDWLRHECKRLAKGIQIAAQYEEQYLAAKDNDTKAELLDHFYKHVQDHGLPAWNTDEGWNFGVGIKLLGGDL